MSKQSTAVASAATIAANRQAHNRNPIIGGNVADTLCNAACAVEFLQRVHSDLADWMMLSETSAIGGPEAPSQNEQRGLHLLLGCIGAALWFEEGARQ